MGRPFRGVGEYGVKSLFLTMHDVSLRKGWSLWKECEPAKVKDKDLTPIAGQKGLSLQAR